MHTIFSKLTRALAASLAAAIAAALTSCAAFGQINLSRQALFAAPCVAYSVVFTGTTATAGWNCAAGPGTAGQALTSNGAGALPTFQTRTQPTRQVFLTGVAQTYTTPANAKLLVIRIKGGGGGTSGSGSTNPAGTAGGFSSFNSITAIGGGVGTAGASGIGGTGGAGTASVRIAGAQGQGATVQFVSNTNALFYGGAGGGTGGAITSGGAGVAGTANSGGGASGPGVGSQTFLNLATILACTGGGEGEYAEIIIASPAATYLYTVGTGGSAGGAGVNGNAGAIGGNGFVIVDEYY